MVSDETALFKPIRASENKIDAKVMKAVSIMDSNGYSGIDQIAGYIVSGDPIYITSKSGCRAEIEKIDRFLMLEHIIKKYVDAVTKEKTTKNKEEN